ncbi:MAG TPA: antibiotic biosynthesis monooxygenase family protein, partial [Parvibaculum sp.]
MSVLGVVATIKVQPGKEAEFEKAFADLRSKVRANEKGNLQYDIFKMKDEPTYIAMEQYASKEALAAHGESEHFKAAGAALGAVLAGAPVLQIIKKVE